MKTAKHLRVEIKYRVGLFDLEMPQNVYDLLIEANNNGDVIDLGLKTKYDEAAEWLAANIRVRDCMDWECDVEEIS
tara:strand:+ start:1533 stop:1760 length:228 start_codon:yes stop_codon:yes gene_type:complete